MVVTQQEKGLMTAPNETKKKTDMKEAILLTEENN